MPYDGYIRHQNDHLSGRMTSCGRGRDSATPKCFGRGSRGTIFVRTSKISLFFPELCSFRRVFCFPRFWKIWRQTFKLWGFGFDDDSEIFLKTPLRHQACFCELRLRPRVCVENFLSFCKAEPLLLAWHLWRSPGWAKHFGDGTLKTRMKLNFRALARSSAEEPSIVVAIATSRVRWSMVQKRKIHKEVSVWLCEGSTFHHLQTSEFWGACFRDPVLLPFSHFAVFVVVDVQLQDDQAAARAKRRKAVIRDTSGVDHWGVTNLSAPIWFTGQGHCTVFRHVLQLSLLVLCWKSTLTVILPQIKKKRSLSNVGHRGTKAENFAWHSTG